MAFGSRSVAALTFVRALEPCVRARAFGVEESGLCAATGLAMGWTQLRGKVIAGQRS